MNRKKRLPSSVCLRAHLLRKLKKKWSCIDAHVEVIRTGSWRVLYLYHPANMKNSNRVSVTSMVEKCLRQVWSGSFFCSEDVLSADFAHSSKESHYVYLLSPLPSKEAYVKFQELYPNRGKKCPF